jgi:hypothetical protein
VNLCHNIECPTKAGKCSRNALNITKHDEGLFEEGSQDCWVTKVPSAYSAATSNVNFNHGLVSCLVIALSSVWFYYNCFV